MVTAKQGGAVEIACCVHDHPTRGIVAVRAAAEPAEIVKHVLHPCARRGIVRELEHDAASCFTVHQKTSAAPGCRAEHPGAGGIHHDRVGQGAVGAGTAAVPAAEI